MRAFGWIVGFVLLGFAVAWAWKGDYSQATFYLVLGIWNLEITRREREDRS